MKKTGERQMKRVYSEPRAERLVFDYKKVVVASGKPSTVCTRTNDLGHGNGCLKPGHAHYNDMV